MGVQAEFVENLLQASCDPSLFHSAVQCKWDKEKKELITPGNKKEADVYQYEDADWYIDSFADFLGAAGGKTKNKGKKEYVAP